MSRITAAKAAICLRDKGIRPLPNLRGAPADNRPALPNRNEVQVECGSLAAASRSEVVLVLAPAG